MPHVANYDSIPPRVTSMFRKSLALLFAALLCCPALADTASFTSTPTQLKKKIIYARAEGEVIDVSFRKGQVFLWDELAASIKPAKNVRPEFGRSYSDFAGAVSEVFVEPGQRVEKGDPLYECRFLEHVYTSCVVPSSLNVKEDQLITATYRGERFEGKVLSTQTDGTRTYVNVLVYNSHEEHYWHLTHGVQLALHF